MWKDDGARAVSIRHQSVALEDEKLFGVGDDLFRLDYGAELSDESIHLNQLSVFNSQRGAKFSFIALRQPL